MVHGKLIEMIRSQYALDWNGAHGIAHWDRVRETGLRLAGAAGDDRVGVRSEPALT